MNPHPRHTLAPAITAALLAAAPAGAQQLTRWVGPADAPLSVTTSWWDPRNWQGTATPTPGDDARLGWSPSFNSDPPAYVFFGDFRSLTGDVPIPGGAANIRNLDVQSGNFVFDFNAFNVSGGDPGALSTHRLLIGDVVEANGFPGFASIACVDGVVSADHCIIGSDPSGAFGRLALSNTDMQIQQGPLVSHGEVVLDDQSLWTTGATGNVTNIYHGSVSLDNESAWNHITTQFWLGHANGPGDAALDVRGGSAVDAGPVMLIGNINPASRATLSISGDDSLVRADNTRVLGEADIVVSNGAFWSPGQWLDLAGTDINAQPGSTAYLTINNATAVLDHLQAARRNAQDDGQAAVLIDAGLMVVHSSVTLGRDATLTLSNGGAMRIGVGTRNTPQSPGVWLGTDGTLQGTGVINAPLFIQGVIDATLDPDAAPLTVNGDVEIDSQRGTLRVSASPGTPVYLGDEFVVLSAPFIQGDFSQFIDNTPYALELRLEGGRLIAAATNAPPRPCIGDINDDGQTDTADYFLFVSAFGAIQGAANYEPRADFDRSGSIDVFDFNTFASNFGCSTR